MEVFSQNGETQHQQLGVAGSTGTATLWVTGLRSPKARLPTLSLDLSPTPNPTQRFEKLLTPSFLL